MSEEDIDRVLQTSPLLLQRFQTISKCFRQWWLREEDLKRDISSSFFILYLYMWGGRELREMKLTKSKDRSGCVSLYLNRKLLVGEGAVKSGEVERQMKRAAFPFCFLHTLYDFLFFPWGLGT